MKKGNKAKYNQTSAVRDNKNLKHLKSVDGSFPCHPMSFHCSEIKP